MPTEPKDLERSFNDYLYSEPSLLTTGVVVLLAAVLLWRMRARGGGEKGDRTQGSSQCLSPTCMRCHGEEVVKDYLMQRYREYLRNAKEEEGTGFDVDNSSRYTRVLQLMESIDHKLETLSNVYRESGYDVELSSAEPHVWYMPGLKRRPVWNLHDCFASADSNFSLPVLEGPELFRAVKAEFERICLEETGWKINSVPTGRWRVFPLFNQGAEIEANTSRCPETSHFLASLPNFMKGSLFGNAMFSSLEPGSTIEPHTGPCNLRLRCHLPLQCPPVGCSMRVGEKAVSWEEGQTLVFDDSYVHTVEYAEQTGDIAVPRVLLIFDVWHPEVTPEERKLLMFIFASQSQ